MLLLFYDDEHLSSLLANKDADQISLRWPATIRARLIITIRDELDRIGAIWHGGSWSESFSAQRRWEKEFRLRIIDEIFSSFVVSENYRLSQASRLISRTELANDNRYRAGSIHTNNRLCRRRTALENSTEPLHCGPIVRPEL